MPSANRHGQRALYFTAPVAFTRARFSVFRISLPQCQQLPENEHMMSVLSVSVYRAERALSYISTSFAFAPGKFTFFFEYLGKNATINARDEVIYDNAQQLTVCESFWRECPLRPFETNRKAQGKKFRHHHLGQWRQLFHPALALIVLSPYSEPTPRAPRGHWWRQ
eukprot:SAG31_NODE_5113_length_2733_cov_16.639831_2_plen_166_part_00